MYVSYPEQLARLPFDELNLDGNHTGVVYADEDVIDRIVAKKPRMLDFDGWMIVGIIWGNRDREDHWIEFTWQETAICVDPSMYREKTAFINECWIQDPTADREKINRYRAEIGLEPISKANYDYAIRRRL
jgi:hypothetical protein